MQLIKASEGVQFRPTGLVFDNGMPQNKWIKLGTELLRSNKLLQWWIGDWLNYGLVTWGNSVKQLRELTEYSNQSLWNMAWVSRAVESSRRREDLAWGIHAEVAALAPAEQIKWLDKAASLKIPILEFRRQLRNVGAEKNINETDYLPFASPTRDARNLIRWLNSNPEDFWTDDRIRLWKLELQPIAKFYSWLSELSS